MKWSRQRLVSSLSSLSIPFPTLLTYRRFLRLGEEALHGTVLSLQSFWHHSQLSSLVVFVLSFHFIVPQVATNQGPVTDLIPKNTNNT